MSTVDASIDPPGDGAASAGAGKADRRNRGVGAQGVVVIPSHNQRIRVGDIGHGHLPHHHLLPVRILRDQLSSVGDAHAGQVRRGRSVLTQGRGRGRLRVLGDGRRRALVQIPGDVHVGRAVGEPGRRQHRLRIGGSGAGEVSAGVEGQRAGSRRPRRSEIAVGKAHGVVPLVRRGRRSEVKRNHMRVPQRVVNRRGGRKAAAGRGGRIQVHAERHILRSHRRLQRSRGHGDITSRAVSVERSVGHGPSLHQLSGGSGQIALSVG